VATPGQHLANAAVVGPATQNDIRPFYAEAKLGIRMPSFRNVANFHAAAIQAGHAARAIMTNTSKNGCCTSNQLIPWTWHDLCDNMHMPMNHGSLWRHLAVVGSVNIETIKAQFEGEVKEGALYFKLDRNGVNLATVGVNFLKYLARARNIVPVELVPVATKTVEAWTPADVRVFVYHLGFGTPDDSFFRIKAHQMPNIDGKQLLANSQAIFNAQQACFNMHTPPGGTDNVAFRAQQVSIIQQAAYRMGFAAEHHEVKARILAQAVTRLSASTMNYLRTTNDAFISRNGAPARGMA